MKIFSEPGEYVQLLAQGVEKWNNWRVKNPDVIPDLSCQYFEPVDLVGVNFSGVDLQEAEFDETNLRCADFSGACLRGSVFNRVTAERSNFSRCNLLGATLIQGIFDLADFSYATMRSSDLCRSDFFESSFASCDMRGTNFRFTRLFGANFSNTNLSGACIKDWSFNEETNFCSAYCDHFYRDCVPSLTDPDRLDFILRTGSASTNFLAKGQFQSIVKNSLECRRIVETGVWN